MNLCASPCAHRRSGAALLQQDDPVQHSPGEDLLTALGPGGLRVIVKLYAELHVIAERALRSERASHTLQPTTIINELNLRLDASHPPEWRDRGHFFAVAENTVHRILIDHARASAAQRRSGGQIRVPPEEANPSSICSFADPIAVQALDQPGKGLREGGPSNGTAVSSGDWKRVKSARNWAWPKCR